MQFPIMTGDLARRIQRVIVVQQNNNRKSVIVFLSKVCYDFLNTLAEVIAHDSHHLHGVAQLSVPESRIE